ncbi:MT-A70 family methyltransferase [Nesterenkonia muleiensis]|uniref:MT-A70 family methyltransferase n=1 Tax=Nesterenkonia muleiensis TaxID=2282648 RepID=UPI000E75777C|nr:MT-A70 family methyltransferase [Nesterenkonia muleiensis]
MSAHLSRAAIDAAHKNLDVSKFPKKKYKTIVLDPPWSTQQRGGGGIGAGAHYDLLSPEKIAELPIPDLLDEDGYVFIWCYRATRRMAEDIAMQAWGLKHDRGGVVWDKSPRMSTGPHLRNSHEDLLYFARGKAPTLFHSQRTVERWPVQNHSRKPEESLIAIQRLAKGPFLEMFARRRFPGFDSWGWEAPGGSDVYVPGFPVPEYSDRAYNPSSGDPQWPDGVIRSGYEYQPSYVIKPEGHGYVHGQMLTRGGELRRVGDTSS